MSQEQYCPQCMRHKPLSEFVYYPKKNSYSVWCLGCKLRTKRTKTVSARKDNRKQYNLTKKQSGVYT